MYEAPQVGGSDFTSRQRALARSIEVATEGQTEEERQAPRSTSLQPLSYTLPCGTLQVTCELEARLPRGCGGTVLNKNVKLPLCCLCCHHYLPGSGYAETILLTCAGPMRVARNSIICYTGSGERFQ